MTSPRLHQEASQFDENNPSPRVYVAPSRGEELRGWLGKLSQLYGLDSYGTILLTKRAAIEMKYTALLLTIIFVFDLATWTLLWNMILHRGKFLDGDFLTCFAVLGGLLISAAIFIYERQFMTADTSEGIRKLLLPVGMRLGIIGAAALITSQPVELLVFDGPIKGRVHKESVLHHATSLLEQVRKAEKDQTKEVLDKTDEGQSYTAAQQTASKVVGEIQELENQLKTARAQRDAARRSVEYYTARMRGANFESREYFQSLRDSAEQRRKEHEDRMGHFQDQIAIKRGEQERADVREKEAFGRREARKVQAYRSEESLSKWFALVQDSKPEDVIEAEGLVFRDQDYDFFGRLRVLNDLYNGEPARWPGTIPQNRTDLETKYGFTNKSDDEALSSVIRFSYWTTFFIALIIPLLVLALKLLIAKELKDYYSREAQERAGNYDTLMFTRVRPTRLEPEVSLGD